MELYPLVYKNVGSSSFCIKFSVNVIRCRHIRNIFVHDRTRVLGYNIQKYTYSTSFLVSLMGL